MHGSIRLDIRYSSKTGLLPVDITSGGVDALNARKRLIKENQAENGLDVSDKSPVKPSQQEIQQIRGRTRGKLEGMSPTVLKRVAQQAGVSQAGTNEELLQRLLDVREAIEVMGRGYSTQKDM